ncbi:MAG: ArsR family transcriptional regulator [Halobacteriota archaeon]|nr:ArsR family transcriptional regulator [Halobacteriota archaeon]
MSDFDTNSRFEIMKLLKKERRCVDELSELIGISPTAVRQHIAILESNGLLGKSPVNEGMGRPKYFYFLTEESEDFFPKAYAQLSEWLIEEILKSKGIEELKRVLRRLGEEQAEKYKKRFGSKSIFEKVETLVDLLEERNNMLVEAEDFGSSIVIIQYNCLFHDISKKFGIVICEFDRRFITTLLGRDIEVLTCAADGDQYCSFRVLLEE